MITTVIQDVNDAKEFLTVMWHINTNTLNVLHITVN